MYETCLLLLHLLTMYINNFVKPYNSLIIKYNKIHLSVSGASRYFREVKKCVWFYTWVNWEIGKMWKCYCYFFHLVWQRLQIWLLNIKGCISDSEQKQHSQNKTEPPGPPPGKVTGAGAHFCPHLHQNRLSDLFYYF